MGQKDMAEEGTETAAATEMAADTDMVATRTSRANTIATRAAWLPAWLKFLKKKEEVRSSASFFLSFFLSLLDNGMHRS